MLRTGDRFPFQTLPVFKYIVIQLKNLKLHQVCVGEARDDSIVFENRVWNIVHLFIGDAIIVLALNISRRPSCPGKSTPFRTK